MNNTVFSGVGHGGNDGGALANGLRESDINLVMAQSCHDVLVAHGVPNPMSRYKDENDPLQEEIREANASGAIVAIDFHNNAGGGDGFEAYHSIGDENGKRLAKCIEKHVVALGQNSRGVKTKVGAGGKDYFGFIRETTMTAIIVESFFLDSNDRFIADTVEEQRAFGIAIAKGILEYLGIAYKGESSTTPTPEPPANNFNCYTVKIIADVLNVRKGPGTNYGIATTVKKNEVYTIVGESNGWGKLKSGAGWISLEYTSRNNSSTPKPPATIKVGSRIKIIGSNYATGQTIPSWVKKNTYTVQQISGSKALIKEIVSWVYIKDLILV